MAEEKYKVKTYKIDLKCGVCGKGWYRPTGITLTSFPMQFIHECNYCGARIILTEHPYPYPVVERLEECADSVTN